MFFIFIFFGCLFLVPFFGGSFTPGGGVPSQSGFGAFLCDAPVSAHCEGSKIVMGDGNC